MKNVGLLTCYLDNCGACLQAYALQQKILNAGYECDIVRYTPPYGYNLKKKFPKNLILNSFVTGILDYIPRFHGIHQHYTRIQKFEKFRKKYLRFGHEQYFDYDSLYKNPPHYDQFVCGSDQIWNPTFYGGNNLAYLLDFVPEGKKRIAYAPSTGMPNLPAEYEDDFLQKVQKFDALSVREQSTANMIQQATGKECRFVLDPTLLLEKKDWQKVADKPKVKGPYVFLYLFGTVPLIERFVEHIKILTDLPVVTIPFQQREEREEYTRFNDASPSEFVSLINHASLVITDSFHATAFSLNLNVPFYTVLRDNENDPKSMNERLKSILNYTEQTGRLIKSEQDFPQQLDFDIDFDRVNTLLQKKRSEDIRFLEDALKG